MSGLGLQSRTQLGAAELLCMTNLSVVTLALQEGWRWSSMSPFSRVMAGPLVPAIHVFSSINAAKTWMPGTASREDRDRVPFAREEVLVVNNHGHDAQVRRGR